MEDTKQAKITTPMAIVIAGVLIMVGILLTNGSGSKITKEKTLSEQVGVSKDKLKQCMEGIDLQALKSETDAEAEKAMKNVPANERGTPYVVITGNNGQKVEVRGAYPKEDIQKLISEVSSGKVTTPYTGDVTPYKDGEHILGNPNAPIKVIEYSDLECPYCKRFGDTMKEVVAESDGNVAWIYRHWVVHPTAMSKTAASECVAKIKGNDAFWKYVDLVFGLMDPQETASDEDKL